MCESCTASPACRMAEEQHVCECLHACRLFGFWGQGLLLFFPFLHFQGGEGIELNKKETKINLKLIGTRWVYIRWSWWCTINHPMTRLDALPFFSTLVRTSWLFFNFVSNDGIYKAEMYQGDDVAQSTGIIHKRRWEDVIEATSWQVESPMGSLRRARVVSHYDDGQEMEKCRILFEKKSRDKWKYSQLRCVCEGEKKKNKKKKEHKKI